MVHGFLIKVVDSLAAVQIAKSCKYDICFYDLEHGVLPYRRLHDLVLYGNAIGIESWVRVCEGTKTQISQAADCGAKGIMVPMVETRKQAQTLVEYAKYQPIGKRSYAGGAQTNYAGSGHHQKHMDTLNESMTVIVQIESVAAVENIDDILSVVGVDAAIVGPVDLGISMGLIDQGMHPDLIEMIAKISDACIRHGVQFGIIGSLELCEKFKETIDIVVDVNDVSLLRSGLERNHKEYIERMLSQ